MLIRKSSGRLSSEGRWLSPRHFRLICTGGVDFPVVKSLLIPGGEFELTPKYIPKCTQSHPKYNRYLNTLPNILLDSPTERFTLPEI